MKFLLAFLILLTYLITAYLFGKHVNSNREYLIYWLKSSLFASAIILIYMLLKNGQTLFSSFDLKLFLGMYLISIILAAIFMGAMIFSWDYRSKYQEYMDKRKMKKKSMESDSIDS